jgi:hypothetical protein
MGDTKPMRSLLSLGAFAYGFWMLWNGSEMFDNFAAIGVMGVAVVLELMARN